MGKNSKILFQNKDAFTRINYLYQAAYMTLTQNSGNYELVRFYIHTLRSIAKKLVLRLHPNVKRTLCKKCSMLLVPGVTARVRKKANRQPRVIVTCLDCKTPKRFPSCQTYQLWCEKQEAWLLTPEQVGKMTPSNPVQAETQSEESTSKIKTACAEILENNTGTKAEIDNAGNK